MLSLCFHCIKDKTKLTCRETVHPSAAAKSELRQRGQSHELEHLSSVSYEHYTDWV